MLKMRLNFFEEEEEEEGGAEMERKGLLRVYGNMTGPMDDFIALLSAFEEIYDLTLVWNAFMNYEKRENLTLLKQLARIESNNRWHYGEYYDKYRYWGGYESRLILPDERLIVSKINFNSDGKIDLLGLGPVLEQIREAIKDFAYRNKQEKMEGTLRIIKQIREAKFLEEEEKRLYINKFDIPLHKVKCNVEKNKVTDAEMISDAEMSRMIESKNNER